MKAVKITAAAFLAAFVALTAVCLAAGPKIRDALSPTADYACSEDILLGDRLCQSLPESAIRHDGEGSYVLLAVPSEKYPERCYEARRTEVEVLETVDGRAALGYGVRPGDKALIGEDVEAGERVVLGREAG